MVEQTTIADMEGAVPEDMITHAVTWQPLGEFTGEIHPVADLFPMMTDDELNDLSEDIKANGQIHPIVLDENGALIDGRNRLAACLRCGVAPVFSRLNGQDVREFIGSVNDGKRRNSTQGQVAMSYVEMYWNPKLSKLDKRQEEVAQKAGVPQGRIAEAVTIKKFAPLLSPLVRSGSIPLSTAYEDAREEKNAKESDEAKFSRLQRDHSELAVKVREGELTLAGALAEAAERDRLQEEAEEAERQRLVRLGRQLDTVFNHLDPRSIPIDQYAEQWLEVDPEQVGEHADFSAARARLAADVLLRYAVLKEKRENGKAEARSD